MRGYPINLDALQRYLWRRADRLGRIRIIQKDLADEFGIAFETVSRVLSRMVEEGRIKKIRTEKNNIGVYAVKEPPPEVDAGEQLTLG